MRALVGLASLCLSTLSACSHNPAPVSRLSEPAALVSVTAPAVFVEQRAEPVPGVVERGPACPAEVGVAPTAFFRDRVLVRLPPGVEGEQVPERSTNFARSPSPVAMGCEPDLAAAVFVESQRKLRGQAMNMERARLFSDLNFPAEHELEIFDGADTHDTTFVVRFPDHPVWGTTWVYMRMVESYGWVHTIGFVTESSDYHSLEPLFAASAKTMIALPD